MSDALLHAVSLEDDYTWEDAAVFGIRFFLRQIGVSDEEIAQLTAEGREIFDSLPIDNRYCKDFAYNDNYVVKIGA